MYILNEKDYIRGILASKKKPDNISIKYLITLISKYYYSPDKPLIDLCQIVREKLLEFNIPGYQEYQHFHKIQKICSSLYEFEPENVFREIEYIPIYENELATINSLPDNSSKKFMFTAFAIARYMNCDGWINKKSWSGLSEVFKLANITIPVKKKVELIGDLRRNGYIDIAKKIDNMNIKVPLDDTGDIVYKIHSFENLGNQYISNFKKGYKRCSNCGCLIKSGGNRKKYCGKCAEKSKHESNRKADIKYKRNLKKRENRNS